MKEQITRHAAYISSLASEVRCEDCGQPTERTCRDCGLVRLVIDCGCSRAASRDREAERDGY